LRLGPLAAAVLALWTGAPIATTPDPAPPRLPVRIETEELSAAGGVTLRTWHYRPVAATSSGVILVHDWRENGRACLHPLALELAQSGFEVLLPQLRGHGSGRETGDDGGLPPQPTPEWVELLRQDAQRWPALFSTPVRRFSAVCIGWSGWFADAWAGAARPLVAVVWAHPVGAAETWRLSPAASGRRPAALLLLASRDELARSRVAEALFSRFNTRAELRLYTRGGTGCTLLRAAPVRAGLRSWLRARSARLAEREAAPRDR